MSSALVISGGGSGGLRFDPADPTVMVQKGVTASEVFIASLGPGEATWI